MVYWTKERNEQLKTYRKEGYSFRAISSMMGISRSAVAGRCHRMNLCNKDDPPKVSKKSKPPAEVEPIIEETHGMSSISKVKGVVASVMAADWRSCRFPLGDPRSEEFQFCSRPTEIGKPYCEAHCKLSYVKSIYS